MLITMGENMYLQDIFVTESLTAHITAIWKLLSKCTLKYLQTTCVPECFITHIGAIRMLSTMYSIMYLQM